MANFYNHYMPYPYGNNQYLQPYQQPNQPLPQGSGNSQIIWVQGESGAKSYLLAPNVTIPLWDSESQTIYLKSTDMNGMPTMKILDYKIREQESSTSVQSQLQQAPSIDLSQFVRKQDIGGYIEQFLNQREEVKNGGKSIVPATGTESVPTAI